MDRRTSIRLKRHLNSPPLWYPQVHTITGHAGLLQSHPEDLGDFSRREIVEMAAQIPELAASFVTLLNKRIIVLSLL